jgi:hypothetical protein
MVWTVTADSVMESYACSLDECELSALGVERGATVRMVEYTEITWPHGPQGAAMITKWEDRKYD